MQDTLPVPLAARLVGQCEIAVLILLAKEGSMACESRLLLITLFVVESELEHSEHL